MFGTFDPATTKVEITVIESGEDCYAAVVDGESGDRLVCEPVTAVDIDVSDAVAPIVETVGACREPRPRA